MTTPGTAPLWPVRCITCGLVLAGRRRQLYYELLRSGLSPAEAMDRIGARRECCRMRIVSLPQEPLGYSIPTPEEEAAARLIDEQEEARLTQPPMSQPIQGVLQGMQSAAISQGPLIRPPRYATTRLLAPRPPGGPGAAIPKGSRLPPGPPEFPPAPPAGSQPIIRRRFKAI